MHLRYNVSYMCLKFDDNANWLHKFYRHIFGVQTIVYEDYVPTHSSGFYALKVLSKSRFSELARKILLPDFLLWNSITLKRYYVMHFHAEFVPIY